jgi:hemoglobin
MNRQPWWPVRAFALGLLVLGMGRGIYGEQDRPATERKDIDQHLYVTLRDVINRGRDYYNSGNPAACYFMFSGALQVTVPMLEHRPELQKTVRDALAEAEANPDVRQRAWVLRTVMDKIRSEVKGEAVAGAGRPGERKPDEFQKVGPAIKADVKPAGEKIDKPAEVSLWTKLGGEPAVTKVVDDFVAMAAEDPKVNITRDGKLKFSDEQVAQLKKHLVAFVSQASGGPIKYTGKSMKEAHKDLAITDAEFDASVDVLIKAMEKNGVKDDEIKAVRGAVEGTRKDIVTKKE